MHGKIKLYVVIILLICANVYCFAFFKPKYTGVDFFTQLAIPNTLKDWQGRDAEQQWNMKEDTYNFISQVFDREYINKNKENIFLLILNAGNFHNPKVCSRSVGFKIKELGKLEFKVSNRTFQASSLFVERDNDGCLIIYWICMNKNIVNWTGQKIKEFYYTLTNKDRTSLMVRLDVPCKVADIGNAVVVAKKFVEDMIQTIPPIQAQYIFGKGD
ncbi:MAG: hypothetical protein HW406_136 [Candidatus Brocadiaceae bacterium]|nr:hypothetical protein [Candidatus Brocadiaceae bacterium]